MPVSEGDTILVSVANLDHQKETPIDVAWSQGLAPVTEKYIQTTFTITTAKGELWINALHLMTSADAASMV